MLFSLHCLRYRARSYQRKDICMLISEITITPVVIIFYLTLILWRHITKGLPTVFQTHHTVFGLPTVMHIALRKVHCNKWWHTPRWNLSLSRTKKPRGVKGRIGEEIKLQIWRKVQKTTIEAIITRALWTLIRRLSFSWPCLEFCCSRSRRVVSNSA